MNAYQYGTTVRFECDFYDFGGGLVDPDIIKITVYDIKYNVVFAQTLDTNYRSDLGKYFYDYVTPSKEQKLYYEWYGEINGKPSIKRDSIMTKFL